MENVKENKMGTMPIGPLLISMAAPMMVSMLVQALYNVVDSIFVARIGEDALAAVSMAFPMQNLMIGFGAGVGVGTNALLSRSLGEKNFKKVNQVAMHGMLMGAICFLLFLVLGLTTSRSFFVLQGASPEIAQYGHDYMSIVLCFSFGIFAQVIFERLLQATGKSFYAMISQGVGAIINIILDPILIFGLLGAPKLGIAGAAIATVTGQVMAGIIAFIFNMTRNHEVEIRLKEFAFDIRYVGEIIFIGVPSIIMIAIGSIMTFAINKILVAFSSTAVAVFGVYFKLQSFAFMPMFGLNNGMVPIVSYNYGARRPERIVKTVKLAMTGAVGIMLAALAVIQLMPERLLLLFNASDEMLAIGVPALRIISISYIFAGVCVVGSSFFQAMGNGMYSTMVSFFRQLVFLVPLAFLFSRTGNVTMVWWAWPIAELASLATTLFYLNKMNNKIIKPLREG